MNILICYMHESEQRMRSYGATNMAYGSAIQGLREKSTSRKLGFTVAVSDPIWIGARGARGSLVSLAGSGERRSSGEARVRSVGAESRGGAASSGRRPLVRRQGTAGSGRRRTPAGEAAGRGRGGTGGRLRPGSAAGRAARGPRGPGAVGGEAVPCGIGGATRLRGSGSSRPA